jgi:hypothetical protein
VAFHRHRRLTAPHGLLDGCWRPLFP